MGANTLFQENLSVNQGSHVSVHRYHGFVEDYPGVFTGYEWGFRHGPDISSFTEASVGTSFTDSLYVYNYTYDVSLSSDIGQVFRSYLRFSDGSLAVGAWIGYKTYAVTATASTPSSSAITSSTATISCDFFPNTNESTATVKMQYRQFGSSTWLDAPGGTSSYSGYSQQTISRNLTGLTSNTIYEFRLSMTRNTSSDTTLDSGSNTFTSLSSTPVVTTGVASSIGAASAILNGTLAANGISTTLSFEYGLTTGYGSTATATPSSSSSDLSFSATISGLAASTVYHFRAKGVYSGGSTLGSDGTFTTAPNPLAEAVQEDHLLIFDYDAYYGVSKAFVFMASSPAASSSDKFLSAASPWANTECIILKDGALSAVVNADGRATNAPTRIGSTAYFTITLVDAELTAENVLIWISDSGNAARDVVIRIRTKFQTGQISVRADQIGSSADAINLRPSSGGYGFASMDSTGALIGRLRGVLTDMILKAGQAQAGASGTITLDALASSTNDYYNGSIIYINNGTGIGQARVITDYDGTSKVANVQKPWATNPSSASGFTIIAGDDTWTIGPSGELSSLPVSTSSYGAMLQFVFQRFAYRRTQTSTTFTMFKADNSTTLATGSVNDDGTIQVAAKLS